MTDAAVDEVEGAEDDAPKKQKTSGKKLVLFVVLPLLLVLAGGGAAAYFFLFAGGAEQTEEAAGDGEAGGDERSKEVVFYDLPEMLVNLNTGGKQNNYLKIRVSLELDDPAAVPVLETVLPRVIDNFQIYLRELRLEDLNGSAGLMRLKEELLIRVNTAAGDIHINDVLFREMLVQ